MESSSQHLKKRTSDTVPRILIGAILAVLIAGSPAFANVATEEIDAALAHKEYARGIELITQLPGNPNQFWRLYNLALAEYRLGDLRLAASYADSAAAASDADQAHVHKAQELRAQIDADQRYATVGYGRSCVKIRGGAAKAACKRTPDDFEREYVNSSPGARFKDTGSQFKFDFEPAREDH